MKIVIIVFYIICFIRSFVSLLYSIIGSSTISKHFITNMVVEFIVTIGIIIIGVFACKYINLIESLY